MQPVPRDVIGAMMPADGGRPASWKLISGLAPIGKPNLALYCGFWPIAARRIRPEGNVLPALLPAGSAAQASIKYAHESVVPKGSTLL